MTGTETDANATGSHKASDLSGVNNSTHIEQNILGHNSTAIADDGDNGRDAPSEVSSSAANSQEPKSSPVPTEPVPSGHTAVSRVVEALTVLPEVD